MTDQWYYAVGKDKIGPLPESKIKELILNGQITLKDLLWKKGMPQWQKAEVIPSIVQYFSQKDTAVTPPDLPTEDGPPLLDVADNSVISKIKSFGSFFSQKASTAFGVFDDKSGLFQLIDDFVVPKSDIRDENKVTGEIVFETKSLWMAGKILEGGVLTLLIDEIFVGGSGSAEYGIHGEDIETNIGRHFLKLKYENILNSEQEFPIHFQKPGHYKIELIPKKTFVSTLPPLRVVATLIGKAKEKLGSSLYLKKLLVGLWEDTNNVGSNIMFTNDGALIRNDGLMAKYNWVEKYKLQVNDLYKNTSFILDVISINQFQMILNQDGQNLVLKKGKSLKEIEMQKEKELMLKQAHLRSEIFKNNAIGVGTMLMGGGLAVLSAGVGIGAAVAGAASSSSSSSKDPNKGLKEPDNRQNDPNSGMKRCQSCGGQGFKYSGNGNSTVCGYCGGKGWGY